MFLFKKRDTKIANALFQSIKNTYRATKKLPLTTNITMVSIHVRLTDYPRHMKKHGSEAMKNRALNEYMANSFLTDAMRYFTNKYEVS